MINNQMRNSLLSFIMLFYIGMLHSQSEIAINQWKSYLPYNEGILLTQNDNKVIYASEWSIFTVDKEDFSIEFLTKVEGLTDIQISAIDYNEGLDQLIICYENSNIDIVSGVEVFNVSNIKQNNSIQGDKRIYDVYVSEDNKAYFSTGFGIVEYDLEAFEFGFTCFTDMVVSECTRLGSTILAATEDGMYQFNLDSSLNPADFGVWSLLDSSNGLPELYEPVAVASKNGQAYMATDRDLYVSSDGEQFDHLLEIPFETFVTAFLSEDVDHIAWGMNINAQFKGKVLHIDPSGSFSENTDICGVRLAGALKDEQDRYWYADLRNEIKYTEGLMGSCNEIFINGPKNHEASDVDVDEESGRVFVASGGVSEAFGYNNTSHGFYILESGDWTNINRDNLSSMNDRQYFNVFQVEKDPTQEHLYVGSYYSGLMRYDLEAEEPFYFDTSNSSLGEAVGDSPRIRISGLAYDENNNLWVSNFLSQRPLSVLTPDGQWANFNLPSDTKAAQIAIDENNYKWIVIIGNNGGVVAYDSGEDILNTGDDTFKFFNLNNSEIQTSIVNCVEVDRDGDVWVGTAEGPVVFECGTGAFDSNCIGNRRRVLQDSIAAFLLQTEDIRAIETDGANRKWFGTKNGIFVQSPDGEEQIAHYTAENSPLFDNTIRDLSFNPETGEMFIATNKGMMSLRTETLGSSRFHDSNIVAFPNPVRPDYNGPIAIKGLATDAEVKITDINGRLIYETNALGGQAIWDGRDYNGRRAATGVYLVFSSSTESFFDPDSAVGKILFIN